VPVYARRKLTDSRHVIPKASDHSWVDWVARNVNNNTLGEMVVPVKHAFSVLHRAFVLANSRNPSFQEQTTIAARVLGHNATSKLAHPNALKEAVRRNKAARRARQRRRLQDKPRNDARRLSGAVQGGCVGVEIVGSVCYLKDQTALSTTGGAASRVYTFIELSPWAPPAPPDAPPPVPPASPPSIPSPTAPQALLGLQLSGTRTCSAKHEATQAECQAYRDVAVTTIGQNRAFEVIDDGDKPPGCLLLSGAENGVVFNTASGIGRFCSPSVQCVCVQSYEQGEPTQVTSVECIHGTNMYCEDGHSSYGDAHLEDGYCDDRLNGGNVESGFDCTDCGGRCLTRTGYASPDTTCLCYGAQNGEIRHELLFVSPPPPNPPSTPERPSNPPFSPLAADQYVGPHKVELQVALSSPVASSIDQTAVDQIIALIATAAAVDEWLFTATFTTQASLSSVASAAAFAMAEAITSPPAPPLMLPNGCPADGSLDVCDVWPDKVDSSLMGAGKYNYLYDDEAGTSGRMGSGSSLFSPAQFTNNGKCDDGAPSANGNPQGQWRLYLYPGVVTSVGANPRSFGIEDGSGTTVVPYWPCDYGKHGTTRTPFNHSPHIPTCYTLAAFVRNALTPCHPPPLGQASTAPTVVCALPPRPSGGSSLPRTE